MEMAEGTGRTKILIAKFRSNSVRFLKPFFETKQISSYLEIFQQAQETAELDSSCYEGF